MTSDTTLNVRVSTEVKEKAARILEASGLTTSMAVRLFLLKVVEEKSLPFEMAKPNLRTQRAIKAGKRGRVTRARDTKDLFDKLNAGR
jgi:DNA-damage-inducible protein J